MPPVQCTRFKLMLLQLQCLSAALTASIQVEHKVVCAFTHTEYYTSGNSTVYSIVYSVSMAIALLL